jgi:hypothetical protein
MNETITQLGIGGVLALLIIREVLGFLKAKKNGVGGNHSGEKSVEFWRGQIRQTMSDVVAAELLPAIQEQTHILEDIREELRMARR